MYRTAYSRISGQNAAYQYSTCSSACFWLAASRSRRCGELTICPWSPSLSTCTGRIKIEQIKAKQSKANAVTQTRRARTIPNPKEILNY